MSQLIKSVIEALGVGRIIMANNGESGFKAFCENAPDIALIDWQMKPTDGITLIKKIRNDPKSPNRTMPVIMMTGYSAVQRVAEARDSGCTEYMVKPFTAGDLAKRLAYVVNKPRDFILTDSYFGPDRRRRSDDNYEGINRRS